MRLSSGKCSKGRGETGQDGTDQEKGCSGSLTSGKGQRYRKEGCGLGIGGTAIRQDKMHKLATPGCRQAELHERED